MRLSRSHPSQHFFSKFLAFIRRHQRFLSPIAVVVFLCVSLLPAGSYAAISSATPSTTATASVTGTDYTFSASQFRPDGSEMRAQTLQQDLRIPVDAHDAVFITDPAKAPMNFTDIGPRWWADTPDGTALLVEVRSGPDGSTWSDWQAADLEDIVSPMDVPTTTYASPISVDQSVRTNRYVQSRITLHTDILGATPIFHDLTYTFIDAGVTPNPPKPEMMAMGTPADVPKPLMVSRTQWGSPDGKSSPKWTVKYKRVTHIIVHHTATPNNDTDFAARVRAIWYFHAHTRGWGDIGYNYLIDPNGVIYEGRAGGDDAEAGHAYPFNSGSMGIGMIGNFMTVAPSAAAQAALIDLISWKVNQRGIDPLGSAPLVGVTDCGGTVTYVRPTIAGHRDYKGTACGKSFNTSTCPGDRLESMLPQIRQAIVAEQPPLRAVFTAHDTPGNMEPGATLSVHLTVRNSGSLTWKAAGQGAVSLGYKWLKPDGSAVAAGWKTLSTPLPRDVPFTDSISVTAKLNVPTNPGHYALIWDLQRDGQGWFADQGSNPLRADVVVGTGVGDSKAPTSSVLPLPVYSNDPDIDIRWAGQDEPRGSGLASYDVQYRIMPQGAWTDWQTATATTQATFTGLDGYTYGFRSRARDAAGNVEIWKDDPQAYTTIDTRPPSLAIDTPQNGGYVAPGKLLVRGRTDPGSFVAVNDQRAEEAQGVFTSTVDASGRDFVIHVTAADQAGNIAQLEITVQASARYSDVTIDNPAFLAIEYLSDQGIISGYADGTFKPDTPVTRAQFVKMLASTLHWGLIKPDEPRFTDVDTDNWQYPYVETAAARGVIDGYPDGSFQPNEQIARGIAVRTLALAAGWKLTHAGDGDFADVPPTHSLFPYVQAAHAHSIVAPDAPGNFYPTRPTTRGAASMMMYALLEDLLSNAPSQPQPTPGDDQGQ